MDIDRLIPNKWNFNVMSDEELEKLKNDIQRRMRIGRPWFARKIVARPLPDGRYEIVDGEQKYRACRELGIDDIPDKYIEVHEWDDDRVFEELWSSNIRGQTNPIKEAEFLYAQWIKGNGKYTQEELAHKYGFDRTRVSKILGRLELHPKIIEDMEKCAPRHISARHLEILRRVDLDRQLKLYNFMKKVNKDRVNFTTKNLKHVVEAIKDVEERDRLETDSEIVFCRYPEITAQTLLKLCEQMGLTRDEGLHLVLINYIDKKKEHLER